jgi:hypothetical protein
MGGVCITASALTLTSNVLYMLRGWKEPTQYFDWASNIVRWMTGQIWYAIGMIVLFHVVTRPAQSGVVLFGKFPRDLWGYKVQYRRTCEGRTVFFELILTLCACWF